MTSRTSAKWLRLPLPSQAYDNQNEAQTRRILMDWLNQPDMTQAEDEDYHGFGFSAGGKLTNSEILGFGIWPIALSYKNSDPLTMVVAENPATASSVLNIKSWIAGVRTTVGTITFALGGSTGTVAWTSSPYTHPAFEILELSAPASADATLAWITGRVHGATL